jgi:hypothetical protein
LSQLDHATNVVRVVEKSNLPEVAVRRCKFFLEEYVIPELQNFVALARAIAATPQGSEDEARVLHSFGITVEWGLIRRVTPTKPLAPADREFLSGMNISW